MFFSLKRIFDCSVAFLLLLILFPLIIFIVFVNGLSLRANPFFVQTRIGLKKSSFHLYKFKTMKDAVDDNGKLLPDADRITRLGSLLRKLSLDELPQLINILKGDMSLVGPRPLLPEYLPYYNPTQQRRHEVFPGITGWAQINGRNAISWEQKFEYDIWYVDNNSFFVDIKIIFLTLKKILSKKGISNNEHFLMKKFDEYTIMNEKKYNILVTGAGALLGQGILRMLQESKLKFDYCIFTADPEIKSAGHWLGDFALIVPMANHPSYQQVIEGLIKKYNIDLILIGTDVELPLFSRISSALESKYNCKVIVGQSEMIDIANDKYLTAKFLKDNGLPYPESALAKNLKEIESIADNIGFPLFAKPKDGARSVGIKKITNREELLALHSKESNMVIQDYLPETEGEFTSGCLVIDGKCLSVVTLRRDLRDGNTYRAYRDSRSSQYDDRIKQIAELFGAEGPVNFQFRIKNGEPVVFEINCRFSGTTPLRTFYGFNEVDAICQYYLTGKPIFFGTLKNGLVMRNISDVFVAEDEIELFQNQSFLDKPKAVFYNYRLT